MTPRTNSICCALILRGGWKCPLALEMIGSRIFHALGYLVAEHHLVYFDRAQLVADPEGEDINAVGRSEPLDEENIDLFLEKVPRDPAKGYRAVAISVPKGVQKLLGPYQFYGTRSDDPNDVVVA